jgi:hypothetical protein
MNSPITNEHSLHGARLLDAAKGILVGLRGYTMADASSEILCTATEYGVGPLSVSHALLGLAEGGRQTHNTPADEAAFRTWASLVRHPTRPRPASFDREGIGVAATVDSNTQEIR